MTLADELEALAAKASAACACGNDGPTLEDLIPGACESCAAVRELYGAVAFDLGRIVALLRAGERGAVAAARLAESCRRLRPTIQPPEHFISDAEAAYAEYRECTDSAKY